MKKRIVNILLFVCIAAASWAGRAYPGVVKHTQPDGTTLSLRMAGDERGVVYRTLDGVILCREGAAFYVADIDNDGSIASTGILAHDKALRDAAETSAAAMQREEEKITAFKNNFNERRRVAMMKERIYDSSINFPHTGTPRCPVVLVQFTDTVFSLPDPKATFENYLNGQGEKVHSNRVNYGSVAQYFEDMSGGAFIPQFDVYGPYTLSDRVYTYAAGQSDKPQLLMNEVMPLLDADTDLSQYDSNGDGYIDAVCVICAGYAASQGGDDNQTFWPKVDISYSSTTYDEVKLKRFLISTELNYNPEETSLKCINGIGLFVHEFSHLLGLPDMYVPSNIDPFTVNSGMEHWDLMDYGEYLGSGYTPTPYTCWEKEAMGWITIDTLSQASDVSLTPLEEGGKAYRIVNDANEDEYFLIENIQQRGWNCHAKGHGMLVYHVDFDSRYFSQYAYPNGTKGHPRMTVIPADTLLLPAYYHSEILNSTLVAYSPQLEKYYGQKAENSLIFAELAGDPYPGTSGNHSLSDDSCPAAEVYTGGTLGKPITDIQESSDGTVTFKFMGGDPAGIRNIEYLSSGDGSDSVADKHIYTLDGRSAGTDIDALPRGIYILGNKKIVK